jgi:hypothetical protein
MLACPYITLSNLVHIYCQFWPNHRKTMLEPKFWLANFLVAWSWAKTIHNPSRNLLSKMETYWNHWWGKACPHALSIMVHTCLNLIMWSTI